MISTRDRVPAHTSDRINRAIQQEITRRARYYDENRDEIPRRLKELDAEWDIERAIQANASALAFIGVAMGIVGRRRWLALPALVSGFLFQHAIQGWCPPIPILRSLGFRTAYEIEQERAALKAIRGDFQRVAKAEDRSRAAVDAAR